MIAQRAAPRTPDMPQTASLGAKPAILVIEDERGLAEEIRYELQAEGYPVELAETRAEGLRAARAGGAAVMVVDRMLHGEDGLSILTTLREEGNATPILVISALSSVDDRIRGLKAGGDDYLVKPFELRELTARVEALSRRIADTRATRLHVGPLEMDLVDRAVWRDERRIELMPREFKLLEYFMRRPNQIVTRAMLLEDVWNYKFLPQTNVVDVHIGNLRRKIDAGGEPRLIVNVRAAGFKLNVDE
jgi:two-component system, OmpR family, response regulator